MVKYSPRTLISDYTMKVLFITSWYPRKDNPVSGVFVRELAKAVSRNDEVRVLHGYLEKRLDKIYDNSYEKENGFEVVRVMYKGLFSVFSYPVYLFSMIQTFRKIKRDFMPDIIHAHVYKSGLIGIILRKFYGIPLVVTEHAEITDPYRKGFSQKIKNILAIAVARFVLNNADLLILPSESLRDYLESFGIKNRCVIVQNVVNTDAFHIVSTSKKNEIKRLLFVGELAPRKGITYLLKALGLLKNKRKDFILDIVGYGSHEEEYKKLAWNLGISSIVRFGGRKNKKEVAELMQKCDFLILPSLYEPFGVVLIEAMACGKPVISTLSGGPKEFVNEKRGILVPPGDPEALAEAIEYMLDHHQEYDQEEIARYVRGRFSYDAVGKNLHDAYIKLLQ